MIPVLALIGIIGSILAIKYSKKPCWDSIGNPTGRGCLIIVVLIVSIITISITSIIYLIEFSHIAEMEAFKNGNMQNYEVTIEETRDAVIILEKKGGLDISVENLKQSLVISERIVELRNEITKYNGWVSRFKRYNSNIWLALVYPNPPEELLKPIIWRVIKND